MAERSVESSSFKYCNDGEFILPIDLFVTEVLSRLPIKSLIRFKCISKLCFSLINRSSFVETYQARKRPFLVIPPSYDFGGPHQWDRRFLMIDTNKPPKSRATVLDPSNLPYTFNAVTNVVNGLVCFYYKDDLEQPIYLYNLSTREKLQLSPTLPLDLLPPTDKNLTRECYFGFDPTNQEYKLLHISILKSRVVESQVLTLGSKESTSWRRIDIFCVSKSLVTYISSCIRDRGFCVDGVIYWIFYYHDKDGILVAFDVEHEKFEIINYPPLGRHLSYHETLAQLRGQLSLVSIPRGDRWSRLRDDGDVEITVWRLLDRKGDNDDTRLWDKEVITRPFLGNSEITCSDFGLVSCAALFSKNEIVKIQCYDLATSKALKFEINNAQGVITGKYPGLKVLPSKMVENIMSLKSIKTR